MPPVGRSEFWVEAWELTTDLGSGFWGRTTEDQIDAGREGLSWSSGCVLELDIPSRTRTREQYQRVGDVHARQCLGQ